MCALSAYRPSARRPAAGPGRRGAEPRAPSCPPAALPPPPSKCCRNKSRGAAAEGGRGSRSERKAAGPAPPGHAAAQVYLPAAVAPTPAGPRHPPGEQKRPDAHHAAARRAARGPLVTPSARAGSFGPRSLRTALCAPLRPGPVRPGAPPAASRSVSRPFSAWPGPFQPPGSAQLAP